MAHSTTSWEECLRWEAKLPCPHVLCVVCLKTEVRQGLRAYDFVGTSAEQREWERQTLRWRKMWSKGTCKFHNHLQSGEFLSSPAEFCRSMSLHHVDVLRDHTQNTTENKQNTASQLTTVWSRGKPTWTVSCSLPTFCGKEFLHEELITITIYHIVEGVTSLLSFEAFGEGWCYDVLSNILTRYQAQTFAWLASDGEITGTHTMLHCLLSEKRHPQRGRGHLRWVKLRKGRLYVQYSSSHGLHKQFYSMFFCSEEIQGRERWINRLLLFLLQRMYTINFQKTKAINRCSYCIGYYS